jgi:hypothetical protein
MTTNIRTWLPVHVREAIVGLGTSRHKRDHLAIDTEKSIVVRGYQDLNPLWGCSHYLRLGRWELVASP